VARIQVIAFLFPALLAAQPSLTTISETLFAPDGSRYNGAVYTELAAKCTAPPGSNYIGAGKGKILVNNGVLATQLVPNTSCTPVTKYKVKYDLVTKTGLSLRYDTYWTVGVSANPVTVSFIETGDAPPAPETTLNASLLVGCTTGQTLRHNGSNFACVPMATTPTASAAPFSDAAGKLAAGWLSEVLSLSDLSDVTAIRGSTTTVQMASGSTTTGHCAQFDASGNLVDSGDACGGSGGSPTSISWGSITGMVGNQTDLAALLNAKESTVSKNIANGYEGLTASTKLQLAHGQEVWSLSDLADVAGKQGNSTTVQMGTGAYVVNHCAKFDANGNIVDAGADCGTGSGAATWGSITGMVGNQTDLVALLNAKESTVNKNVSYAGLSGGKLALSQGQEVWALADLSDVTAIRGSSTTVQMASGAVSTGDCPKFDASGNLVSAGFSCASAFQVTSAKDQANGYAGLSGSSKITASQVQEVLALADLSDVGSKRGTSTQVQMTTGSVTTNNCAKFDVNGNLVDAGTTCGGGGGGGSPPGSDGDIAGNIGGSWTGITPERGIEIIDVSGAKKLRVKDSTAPSHGYGTGNVNFSNLSTGGCSTAVEAGANTITVSPATTGEVAIVGGPSSASIPTGAWVGGTVTATNTVSLYVCNFTGSNLNLADLTYTVWVPKKY